MGDHGRPVLVLGHHRSGTTWTSTVLGAAAGHRALPGELSNPSSGYRLGGQELPPYVTHDQVDHARTDRALERLARRPHPSLFSRRELHGWIAPRGWSFSPVFKDPLGARIGGYIADALDARVLVVVRHPGAIWVSLQRVGWDRSLPQAGGPDEGATDDSLTQFAKLWSTVYRELSAVAADRDWPVVRHEDLAREPRARFRELCERLDVPFDQGVREEIERTTEGAETTPSASVVHALERDSAAVVDAWRGRIDPEDLARIEAMTSEIAGLWYG